ncbi:COP1-interacting protein [Vigna angularis]|uniref:COP1-interacting protein n=2 Tax=Phaseolus angularis TaxID=3914 RepID=A0A8T0KPJ2_PHAAN|nr:COP1-interacting protein 7 [Vigna angularis]KAG2402070.1 COP1-interacting protein [Vigna angularis]BAT94781.1 hypothetical protein VIGAN_08141500 [Vigna angularis var. angularis]
MKASTRLDSAVFQLTPTRTRFDLVIIVNGKKEKIASGLLSPFLSHLKAAQNQMDKGGYSIVLEPPDGNSDTSWFTKGTVERFVRFVSTPEILERVYTVESEILQIEEAIAIQGNNSLGISTVEENQTNHVENIEGRRTQQDNNEERAIVLYKPDAQPPQANGTTTSEGNSKAHLLKVLETRKSALQKEQGMAFARAVAAGFDEDHIPPLMSFAECFGASRMKDACTKFRDLWRRKHETGQWLEIEAAETMSNRSDFSALNASGIILPNMVSASHTELDSGSNDGKASSDVPLMDRQPSIGNQDNIQGQFPHMFSPWPIHSPPGAVPVFQPCPVQGIPYYQAYPGNSPFMQPNYSPMEDPRLAGQSNGCRRHSMDSRHSNTESELTDDVDIERDGAHTGGRRKKDRRSGKKSGMVVIRNINYITKAENSSDSGSHSDSASETNEDNKESVKTSKRRDSRKEALGKLDSPDREKTDQAKDEDGGHWQAFENCLLRDADDDRHTIDPDQFDLEKLNNMRRKKHIDVNDPLVFTEREMHEGQGSSSLDMHSISKGLTHMPKRSNNDLLLSARTGQSGDGRSGDDVQSFEVYGKRSGYRKAAGDYFITSKQESELSNAYPSSYMETSLGYSSNKLERKLFHDMNDDSYILEHRSIEVNDAGIVERNAIDMDSEIPNVRKNEEKSSAMINHISNELDELSMLPERGAERGSMSYDPAFDYEMQAQAGSTLQNKNKEVVTDTKPGSKKLDKEPKSKVTPNNADRRKSGGPIRRGKTSKLSPLDEARARAESLRNYKADLQKMKKEKEEEEMKRLEALKTERQKRIAAKSSSTTTPSQLTKKQLSTKLSPSSHKGSKFSDSVPGASSPLQRFPIRTASVESSDSLKLSKTSRLISRSYLDNNKLSRSVSSLPESKLEKDDSATDTKASMRRIRRLSEPKVNAIRQTSSVKPLGTGTISKAKAADGPESKKISAIVSHDKSKTAALPELKIRTAKASDIPQNRTSVKDKGHKLNDSRSSMASQGTMSKKKDIGTSSNGDRDDNPVVEKTVVMLECERPYAPPIHNAEENFEIPDKQYDNDEVTEKTEIASNYAAIRAPVSPLSMDIIDKETSESQSHLQSIYTEVKMDHTEREPSKSSSLGISGETYQAPYARVSSMEDPSTRNSEYGKAAPTSLETAAIGVDTAKAHVSNIGNSTLEKIPEAIEKPQVKESSSKGFRRLLKFGKKSHRSVAERSSESDNVSIDGSEADEIGNNGSSNEVHTLKNLISQDETPTASTSQQKSSRSFSLLSPFRSKSNEKRIMMA